jgi:hypothetical protein
MRQAALIALAVALAAGCGGSHAKPTVVPWVSQPPPSAGPGGRPCTASVLRATPVLSSATGGLVGEIQLRNAGKEPCSLSGKPAVKLRPALPQSVTSLILPGTGLPASWLRSLGGDRRASLPITLFNWCYPPQTTTLVLTLSGGRGRLTVPLHESPRCIVAATPTTISLAAFQPSGGPTAPWTQQVAARVLPQTLKGRAGQVLRYQVELTNHSRKTVALKPCPFVSQALAHGSTPRVDVLNCGPAGELKPGNSVIFQMELGIPATVPGGPNSLSWTLDPFSTHPAQASAGLQIAAQ